MLFKFRTGFRQPLPCHGTPPGYWLELIAIVSRNFTAEVAKLDNLCERFTKFRIIQHAAGRTSDSSVREGEKTGVQDAEFYL